MNENTQSSLKLKLLLLATKEQEMKLLAAMSSKSPERMPSKILTEEPTLMGTVTHTHTSHFEVLKKDQIFLPLIVKKERIQ